MLANRASLRYCTVSHLSFLKQHKLTPQLQRSKAGYQVCSLLDRGDSNDTR
jgi:hypothetical protein